jgi:hypothetical protein
MTAGVAESVAAIIETGTTAYRRGVNIFGDVMPETTGVAIAVVSAMGLPPVTRFGSNLPAFEIPRVVVLARSTAPAGNTVPDPTNALAAIRHAWEQMERWAAGAPSSGHAVVHRCETLHSPFLSDRDSAGRVTYEFSAHVWIDPSTA